MKISIFVACLALLYGTCKIYAEEHVDSIEEVTHDGNYTSKPPSTKDLSPSKKKRSLLSPLEMIGSNVLGLGNNALEPAFELIDFGKDLFLGKNVCSTGKKSLFDLIEITHPIQTFKNIVCYFVDIIDTRIEHGREIIFDVLKQFFKMFLPKLHTGLNWLKNSSLILLLPQLVPIIEAFNALYVVLQILGYVP